ncbi:MAG: hypothetical protein KDA89_04595, partial [Planctomycetaceae bacterium]|nr:hypothetical protein [Planctomycetaceae bacterium]
RSPFHGFGRMASWFVPFRRGRGHESGVLAWSATFQIADGVASESMTAESLLSLNLLCNTPNLVEDSICAYVLRAESPA